MRHLFQFFQWGIVFLLIEQYFFVHVILKFCIVLYLDAPYTYFIIRLKRMDIIIFNCFYFKNKRQVQNQGFWISFKKNEINENTQIQVIAVLSLQFFSLSPSFFTSLSFPLSHSLLPSHFPFLFPALPFSLSLSLSLPIFLILLRWMIPSVLTLWHYILYPIYVSAKHMRT